MPVEAVLRPASTVGSRPRRPGPASRRGALRFPKRKAVCEEEEGGQEDGPPCSQTLPFDMHIQSRHTFRLENSPPSSPEGKYEPRGCWKEHPGFPLGLQQRCNHRPGRSPLPGRGGCPQEGRDRQASACSRQAPSKTTKRGCFRKVLRFLTPAGRV